MPGKIKWHTDPELLLLDTNYGVPAMTMMNDKFCISVHSVLLYNHILHRDMCIYFPFKLRGKDVIVHQFSFTQHDL